MKRKYENDNEERKFKGVWIDKDIWLDYDLNACEKVLLVEIDSLDNEPTHCFAENEYFAKFLGVSNRTVTRYISHLKQLGYIYVKDESKYKNKDYDRVIISLLPSFNKPKEITTQGIDKLSNPPRQIVQEGETNCLNNNIYNNTTNNDLDLSLPIFTTKERKKQYKQVLKQIESLNCSRESMIKLWNKIALNNFKDPEGKDIKNMTGYMISILSKNPHMNNKKTKNIARMPDYNSMSNNIDPALLEEAKNAIRRRAEEARIKQEEYISYEKGGLI